MKGVEIYEIERNIMRYRRYGSILWGREVTNQLIETLDLVRGSLVYNNRNRLSVSFIRTNRGAVWIVS